MRDTGGAPEGSDGDDAHLQPGKATKITKRVREAESSLDRLLADSEILLRLQLSGYAKREWEPIATEFARYGLGILPSWLVTGQLFREVKKASGITLTPPEQPIDAQTRIDLATDTVVAALPAFLTVLKQNRWDPQKGASLKTYFVGQCKLQFPNVYKRWRRQQHRTPPGMIVLTDSPLGFEAAAEPLSAAADTPLLNAERRAGVLSLLSTDQARQAFTLIEMGYSHLEVAHLLELPDEKAVGNMLGHQRRRLTRTNHSLNRRAQ